MTEISQVLVSEIDEIERRNESELLDEELGLEGQKLLRKVDEYRSVTDRDLLAILAPKHEADLKHNSVFGFFVSFSIVLAVVGMLGGFYLAAKNNEYSYLSLAGIPVFVSLAFLCYCKIRQIPEYSVSFTPVEQTKIPIPYGAKLKIKEAKDKDCFNNISIAYPTVMKRPANRDPAIVGFCGTDMYLIFWWDVK